MSLIIIDYPEEWSTFEGLSKPVRLIWRGDIKKPESWPYCVINGRYRDCDGREAAAIAIGLWDEERNCFSALKKMKDGKSLPLPFAVKVDKSIDKKKQAVQMRDRAEEILRKLSHAQNLEDVLEKFEKAARANQ